MEKKDFLGIDVSKLTIDCHLHTMQITKQFKNTKNGFKSMERWIKQKANLNLSELVICFEATGGYSFELSRYLANANLEFTVDSGYRISRTLGLVRGKNDSVDALRIAEYAYRYADKLRIHKMPSDELILLQKLYNFRRKLKKDLASYKTRLKEEKRIEFFDIPMLNDPQTVVIESLKQSLADVEESIKAIIKGNSEMQKNYDLLVSIKGIGFVTATLVIALTANFTLFDDPKKFASYSGTAPFSYQSGTSINKGKRVSKLANAEMRSLLTQAAKSARQHDPELKAYADTRAKAGKSPMSTINILRNKLISRMFAVIRKQKPYEIRVPNTAA